MDSMFVRVPVAIKAKVTQDTKMKIIADLEETIKQMQTGLESFEFEAKKAMNQAAGDLSRLPALREQIEIRRAQIMEEKEAAEAKLERAKALEMGAEIGHGTLERTVEVKIGDNLDELTGAEIVTEDGKIIAFRG